MSPGPTFERIYLTLRGQIVDGRLRPGMQLEPALLSEDLHSSITPVRDALHRLVGERLVEAPRHNGFRVPLLTEAQLRDLYQWNTQLLELALRPRRETDAPAIDPQDDSAGGAAALFHAIAAQTGSAEHLAAIGSLNSRLGPIRRIEARVLDRVEAELSHLRAVHRQTDLALLRREIRRYHERRRKLVARLVAGQHPDAG